MLIALFARTAPVVSFEFITVRAVSLPGPSQLPSERWPIVDVLIVITIPAAQHLAEGTNANAALPHPHPCARRAAPERTPELSVPDHEVMRYRQLHVTTRSHPYGAPSLVFDLPYAVLRPRGWPAIHKEHNVNDMMRLRSKEAPPTHSSRSPHAHPIATASRLIRRLEV